MHKSHFLKIKSTLRFFFAANLSITLSLKFRVSLTIFFSMESIDRATRRSSAIELRKKFLMRFKVEKERSASAVDMGIVISISKSFLVSRNEFVKLFSMSNFRKGIAPCRSLQSGLE